MKGIVQWMLILCPAVGLATTCPSLDLIHQIHFDSIVKVNQGMINAGANLNGVTDEHHQRWQFILAPIFSSNPSDAEQFLPNIDIASTQSQHKTRNGVEVEECLYLSTRSYHQVRGFNCGKELCFKSN